MSLLDTPLTRQLGIETPLICGAMYPCSNPELVAAASEAGGIGVLQPLSMVYVHGHEFAEGMKLIRRPERPKWRPFVHITYESPLHESWRHFVDLAYWNVELGEEEG